MSDASGPSGGASALAVDPALHDLIRSLRATALTRVFSITYDGHKLWVKTAGAPRLRSSVLLQRAIAALFALPILRPARNRAGAMGLAAEAGAARHLAAAGFPVPGVLACTGQWLVLSDAGEALEARLNATADIEQRWQMIHAAGRLLARLHAANLWHGGAQIRNFSWHNGAPGLLDLEDHDLPGMTLPEKQARDLLLFLYSLMRYDRNPRKDFSGPPRMPALAAELLAQATPEVRESLRKLRRRMAWLLGLARLIAPHAGRDVRQAVAADDALRIALD
jgi:tRNA A-37 threonylcarbamoyl transferase component Bud32